MRLLFALVVSIGTAFAAFADNLQMISPQEVDVIHAKVSESKLRRIFGEERVHAQRVSVGEGFVCHGTRVDFPNGESLEVAWVDGRNREKPDLVKILGVRWATSEGLRLGSRLKTVEAMNGGPFELSGFGWDYGGTVGSWKDGRLSYLQSRNGGGLVVRFAADPGAIEAVGRVAYGAVSGDGVLLSSRHATLQKLNPRVSQLTLHLNGPDCDAFFSG